MARPGITEDTVKYAANKLLSQGIAPSVQKVRDILGTGSNTTIAQHLKLWREDYAKKKVHHLPANMPKELIATFEVLWQTAMEHASQQLAIQKTELEEERNAVLQSQKRMADEVSSLQSQLNTLQKKLENETQENQALKLELALANEKLEQKASEIINITEQCDTRVQRAEQAQHTALDEIESLTTEVQKLKQQMLEQLNNHQSQLTQERSLQEKSEARWLTLVDKAREELKQKNKEYDSIITQKNSKISMLEETLSSTQKQLFESKTTLAEYERRLNENNSELKSQKVLNQKAIEDIALLKAQLVLVKQKQRKSKKAI